ncbi:MAG: hypothetical protein KIH62_004460 [Candidatus Kerfeldbacteria bacterium]|nr:hypothetical protein [Candidatus Kerfeldbacteria bacterium]
MEHKLKFKHIGVAYVSGLSRRFRSNGDFGDWISDVHEWRMIGKLQPLLAYNQWPKAVRGVVSSWKKCDGFVVILSRADFFFYAQTIAMMLGTIGKPIVYVCTDSDTDANESAFRVQMIDALQTVVQDISGHLVIRDHAAIPLQEYAQSHARTMYGYFDFGLRLSPHAPRRTVIGPKAPHVKVSAVIATSPTKGAHAIISNADIPSSRIPVLIISKSGVKLRASDGVHVLKYTHTDTAKAQFMWAVQKGVEAGDFSDIAADMQTPRIDTLHERL